MRIKLSLVFLTLGLGLPLALHSQGQLISAKEIYVDHGDYSDVNNPPCKGVPEDVLGNMVNGIQRGQIKIPSLGKIVGAWIDMGPLPGIRDALGGSGGDLTRLLKPNRYANCGGLVIQIPHGTTNVSFHAFAAGQECSQRDGPYFYCKIGWSAWGLWQAGDFVTVVFKNWSHDSARTARIEIYGSVPALPASYTVHNGDCLAKIAQKVYGKQDWRIIYKANKRLIRDPNLIYQGQTFVLPTP
jgi:hypothetical protein